MIWKKPEPEEIDAGALIASQRGPMIDNDIAPGRSPGVGLFMKFILLFAAVMGGLAIWQGWQHSQPSMTDNEPKAIIAHSLPPLTPYLPPPEPAIAVPVSTPETAPPAQEDGQIEAAPTPEQLQMQRRFSGGFTGHEGNIPSDKPSGTRANEEDAGTGPLASQLGPLKLKPSEATMLADRNYLLTRGAMIDCGQQTKLVTDQPGMVTCYTTSDTYSASGHVVLVDAGSKIVGSYQRGVIQGQNRVFVAWQRIETPEGVIIDLDSPGTDPLGAAGEPGDIDTHFWDRFGGAIMLSLIGDAGSAGVQAVASRNDSNVTLNNTVGTANQMSAEALRSTINIPPTLYKDAGDRVSIYVARDLDFGDVYALKPE